MTTTRQPRQFLAVWNDDGTSVKGATFEESIFVDGAFWKNELTPVAPENFGDFGTMFSNQLQVQHAALASALAAANARIAELLQAVPFNPRIIDATAFYDRLTKDEILTLFSSSDATTKQIGEMILAYKTNDWPVVFESPEFQQMLGYLLQTGTLTESRMAELTRDATRAEAYQAD